MPELTRRSFMKRSMQSAAALTAGATLLSSQRLTGTRSASEKVVLALIGSGGRGRSLAATCFSDGNVEFKYVCDVDQGRAAAGIKSLQERQDRPAKHVADMREVFDDKEVHGVIVATPEHWHALATVWACQAGKDVYVEKHTALTIRESRKMVQAARKHNRIVQTGYQNRSAPYSFSARQAIQSGELGKVLYVKVFSMLPRTYGGSPFNVPPDAPTPEGLDWDRWLGPAPEVRYNPGRHRNWYGYWEYSGGSLAADASHNLDLARMAVGDPPHPGAVNCSGGRLLSNDNGNIPELQIVTYEYDKFVMTCENTGFTPYIVKSPRDVRYGEKFPHWPQNSSRIEIYGTRRMMYLGRHGGGWQIIDGKGWPNIVRQEYGYHPDKWHVPTFIESIRSRKTPNGDIEQGHYSATLVNMANVAYRVGTKKLHFDGRTETFTDCREANDLSNPVYREHYRIPDEV